MVVKTLTSDYISNHPYFTARKDGYLLPDGRKVDPYFVVEMPTCVVAMALTEHGEVIMEKQYRYPVNEELLELPGGFIEPGEDPDAAVRRELLEETGYAFDKIQYLGSAAANPGVLNNYTHFYLALQGKKVREQSLDPNEKIDILLKPLHEVRQWLSDMQIKQSLHALCLFYGFEFLSKNAVTGEGLPK